MSKKDYMDIVNANCFDSYKESFPNVLFVRCFVRDNFISAKSNHFIVCFIMACPTWNRSWNKSVGKTPKSLYFL